ncbi:thiamine pyrophosphate-binding protein [Marinobacter sp. F4206]|uniref:thiamine pyrophosphate-binding protein n=1 Tax=Marinobacter sp. F4206 TaxID=2861777 RepID=UPI001C5DCDFA|nr:thiamine pyrophosphate-binding protein [Marinobacter sp. F4206]MBW4934810.1 thiamine pyrophosphate-binding protein [Marinobacter sp. F4206]
MLECGDLILRYLERLGVDCVFGVPGGSIEPFYNALARSERRGGIRSVTARHETGAAFMADGYARESGRLGVCCATAGPGATNLITGVAAAYADNIPMLVISAQTSLDRFGQGALQESSCTSVNTIDMFASCTRYNTLVSHPEQLVPKLLHAIGHALGHQPGPVHLSIPLDVMRHALPDDAIHTSLNAFVANEVMPGPGYLQKVAGDLKDVSRATIVLGEDAASAVAQLTRLAEIKGWQLVTTPRAKGIIDSFHPLYRGVFGFAGHRSASEALKPHNAERIIVVGAALDEVSTAGWDPEGILSGRLIHIARNPDHLTRATMAREAILGEPRLVVEQLLGELAQDSRNSSSTQLTANDGLPAIIDERFREGCYATSGPVKPQALITYLSRACPDTTRALFDSGNSFLWGIHHWNVRRTETLPPEKNLFHIGIGFAPMGWAIGASVGVAMAAEGAPVLCITGDGSYLMSGQELTTAAQEGLNVLMVVLNDSSLGMVRHGQALGGAEPIANSLPTVNFAKLAEALGVKSHRIASMEELYALDLTAIFDRSGPCLLDVLIDADEVPPMGARMKVLTGTE